MNTTAPSLLIKLSNTWFSSDLPRNLLAGHNILYYANIIVDVKTKIIIKDATDIFTNNNLNVLLIKLWLGGFEKLPRLTAENIKFVKSSTYRSYAKKILSYHRGC